MLSTHLIVDEFARKGRVGLFWKKIAANFMEHMAPAQVSQTHSQDSVAALIQEAVKNGSRKIILMGDEHTVFVGINALMRFPQNLRQKFAIGLWLVRDWDLLFYPRSHQLALLAQVFKAGHTFPLDLAKVALNRQEQPVQDLYFGRQCEFSYVETPCQTVDGVSKFFNSFSPFIPFHIATQGQLQVEEERFDEQGGLNIRVRLHSFAFHSLEISPHDLKKHPKFLILWQKGMAAGGQWLEAPTFVFDKQQGLWGKTEQKTCESLQVAAWNNPLSMKLDGQPHLCTKAQFELVQNALPVIIKMAPVRFKEATKFWGGLKSKTVVARGTVQNPRSRKHKAGAILPSKSSF